MFDRYEGVFKKGGERFLGHPGFASVNDFGARCAEQLAGSTSHRVALPENGSAVPSDPGDYPKRFRTDVDRTVRRNRTEMRHEDYMCIAIESARTVPVHPFGAVIVRPATEECLAVGANRSDENPILHGEIDVINRCAAAHPGIDWSDLALYTTAEPCPMCQSAIAWAGIPKVYYGTLIPRLQDMGWRQIDIRAEEVILRTPFRDIRIVGGILETECDALFAAAAATRRIDSGKQPVTGRRASDVTRR